MSLLLHLHFKYITMQDGLQEADGKSDNTPERVEYAIQMKGCDDPQWKW